MSLINNKEQEFIKKIADAMHNKEIADKTHFLENTEDQESSCWIKREKVKEKMDSFVVEYDFNNPMELQECLNNMWNKFYDDEMKEFTLVCSVAAFKNRQLKEEEQPISTFVYEF